MVLGDFVVQTLHGLQYAFILFLIAIGLSVVFGVMGVLNLAHGELFALGAYISLGVFGYIVGTVGTPSGLVEQVIFVATVLAAALVVAAILLPVGAIIETVFMRPVYGRQEVYELMLTFGLLLILVDVKKFIWGARPERVENVYQGVNSIQLANAFGLNYPTYNLLIIVVGALVFGLVWWFFAATKTGRIIRATAIDREMATAIGVSTARIFTLVFAVSAFLAGFSGALIVPPTSATLFMGLTPLVLSFVVLVIGGLGSIEGTVVGALVVGLTSRWGIWLYPPAELAAPFAIMILVLLVKPEGLFGTWGELE
jgi:branched-chain amino acid transport system permease protein